jgi:hypothetical protein
MKDLSLRSLKEFLGNFSDIVSGGPFTTNIEIPFRIKPHEFLKFAEHDLNNAYEHHLVNALSNIKRATDCQFDSLLVGFGLYEISRRKNLDFPRKVDLLNSLGIVSPDILGRINKKRNLLEHEYANPDREGVQDALDVITLFLAYTDRFLCNALIMCEPHNTKTNEFFAVALDYKNRTLSLSRGDINTQIYISAESEEYLDYLRLFLSLYNIL